jgi:hypothetical protein
MMNAYNTHALKEFLITGMLGRFSPTMNVQDALDVCESMKEDVTLIYVGNEGIRYGRLFICGTPGIAFESNPINRIGVNFWTRQTTKLLEEIPWYTPLSKMSRHEVYALLRKMGIPFFERVHHWRDGTSFSEEISIGHIPLTIISFYTPESSDQEIPYHIIWFRDGLDEGDSVELREPSKNLVE